MKNYIKNTASFIIALVLLTGCTDTVLPESNQKEFAHSLSVDGIIEDQQAVVDNSFEITASAATMWRISPDNLSPWFKLSQTEGKGSATITYSMDENTLSKPREGTIKIEAFVYGERYFNETFIVKQMGTAPYILILEESDDVSKLNQFGGEFTIKVKSNLESWSVDILEDETGATVPIWVTSDKTSSTMSDNITLSVERNKTDNVRKARIVISDDSNSISSQTINLEQAERSATVIDDLKIFINKMKGYLSEGSAVMKLKSLDFDTEIDVDVTVTEDESGTTITLNEGIEAGPYLLLSYDGIDLGATIAVSTGSTTVNITNWNNIFSAFGGDIDKPFMIDNGAKLKALADAVNAGDDYSGVYLKLKEDISLSAYTSWTPIGNKSNPFKGNFDGNNKSITGLKIVAGKGVSFQGLFGYVAGASDLSLATIKNIKLVGTGSDKVDIDVANGAGSASIYAGSVAGCALDNVLIDNCTSSLVLSVNSVAGGIVGGCGVDIMNVGGGTYKDGKSYANVTVSNCHNTGAIKMIGWWGTYGNSGLIGGVVGRNHGVVQFCSNTGNITTNSTYDYGCPGIGGVAGANGGTVKQCFNAGSIISAPSSKGISQCGGIVGAGLPSGIAGTMLTSYIQDCYNTGALTLNTVNVGGILGVAINNAQAGIVIDRCYNIGQVGAGTVASSTAGGILGTMNTACGLLDVEFCLTSPTKSKQAIAKVVTDISNTNTRRKLDRGTDRFVLANDDVSMKTKETYTRQIGTTGVYWTWDFTNVWTIDPGTSTPYLRNNIPTTKPGL